MKRTYALLWVVLGVMLAILALLAYQTFGPKAVCHSIQEDSGIYDCTYSNGTWSTK
jgi:hypothetical protein